MRLEMNFRDLEYFSKLAELNSFTATARELQVSQPTITYAIKRLEERFNCSLLVKDPSHRSVVLTQQGKILAQFGDRMLAELTMAQKAINRVNQKRLTVGFPPIIRSRILSQFLEDNQDVSFLSYFQMVSQGSKDLLAGLLSGDLDFCVLATLEPLKHEALMIKELYQEIFYFVMPKKHPLSQKDSLSFSEVLDEPFILLNEGYVHLELFYQLNRRHRNQATIRYLMDDPLIIEQMVRENLGITILSDSGLVKKDEELVRIPIKASETPTFHVSYAYPSHLPLSPELEEFIEELKTLPKKFL